jgi:hypothetical protein
MRIGSKILTKRHTEERKSDRQTSKQTNRQTNKETDKKTDRPKCNSVPSFANCRAGEQVSGRQVREDHRQHFVRKSENRTWPNLFGDGFGFGNLVDAFLTFLKKKSEFKLIE